MFLLHGKNSIASKCPSMNGDLRSSRKLEENTEDKTEAMLDIPAKPRTTEFFRTIGLHKQPLQQLFYLATAENIVQPLTVPN